MSDDRAQVVVIGGGIAGVSAAYHLALAGMRDVLLIEKGDLTSGSTHHAAGLVTQFNPSPTMMRFRRYSVQLYRRLGVFERYAGILGPLVFAAMVDATGQSRNAMLAVLGFFVVGAAVLLFVDVEGGRKAAREAEVALR